MIRRPPISTRTDTPFPTRRSSDREKTDHLDNRLVFISALWVALTTAILCAILPAGLPLTKAVGSAFSPSTTIVAFRAKAEQVRDTEKHFVKGDPERLKNLPLPTSHVDFTIPGVAALERSYTVQVRHIG